MFGLLFKSPKSREMEAETDFRQVYSVRLQMEIEVARQVEAEAEKKPEVVENAI